ncbi:MAG TPA: malate synthase A [Candidatus Polarisedimenticolaceae bacterium]|nr:malate synthase A [Candidatus Polarisedimenticolaceae bacterium]
MLRIATSAPEVVLASPLVLAADKPAGMLTIPGRRGSADERPCLIHELARSFPGKIWIVHRLDLEASGLVLFARTAETHRTLCALFEHRTVRKRYEAWTEGEPPPADAEQVWESRLVRGKRRAYESERGKWSRTRARFLGAIDHAGRRWLRWELYPETGRPHQLRCQLAARGWPVAGDRLYGARDEFAPGAIALRALALDFSGAPAERAALELPERLEVAPLAERLASNEHVRTFPGRRTGGALMGQADFNRVIRHPRGLTVEAGVPSDLAAIASREALEFVEKLVREFAGTRRELLRRRAERQLRLDAGELPDFLDATAGVRARDWSVAPIPADLRDRRVEITGPVERKMIINALNSGASVFMADFEDAHSPTWLATLQGQLNLVDAVRRTITYLDPQGKRYALGERTATLMVRPRGWHLVDRNVSVDGEPVPASLLDFGLFLFHNGRELLERGSGPYFYLPKLESHLEARLWNDVFRFAQHELGLPQGSIRATVLIETILAAFEMDEILWELRDHSAGLNCGRWDYIFSIIKKFREHVRFVLPDRAQVTMTRPFMRAYTGLAIRTCHRRGIHAIGGMAAQIPIKSDPQANEEALAKVRADKEREAGDGHDGTWVAHPGLVALAKAAFDARMPEASQIHNRREDVQVGAAELLAVPEGPITEAGLRHNLDVAVQYLEAWLGGLGCVPLYNLMEDAATAEISRSQVWQWIRHAARLEDGRSVTRPLVREWLGEELKQIEVRVGAARFSSGRYERAARLIERIVLDETFTEFMTLAAYDELDRPNELEPKP